MHSYSTQNVERVAFDVVIGDDVEEIARGTHERFVVRLDKFTSKLDDKRRRVDTEGN